MLPMIFIHIPKTAGTSFRLGARAYFGPEYEIKDYGPRVEATSPMVRKIIYQQNDFERFRKVIDNREIKFVTGHFPSEKYLAYFDMGTFVTFVRDPVQRVVSEYKHAVRVNGFNGTLREFCRRPRNINRQWEAVRVIGIENMAFVGLTEQYETSLSAINAIFGTDIMALKKNIGKETLHEQHPIDPPDVDFIKTLNHADVALYEEVTDRFTKADKPFSVVCRDDQYKGNVGGIRDGKIFGWAVNETREAPVVLNILINGEMVAEVIANRYRPHLKDVGITRSGCAGVLFDLGSRSVRSGDIIAFQVVKTGQVLGTRRVTAEMVEGGKNIERPTSNN